MNCEQKNWNTPRGERWDKSSEREWERENQQEQQPIFSGRNKLFTLSWMVLLLHIHTASFH